MPAARCGLCRPAAGPLHLGLDGLGDFPQDIDELDLGQVERLDLQVRRNTGLKGFELHALVRR